MTWADIAAGRKPATTATDSAGRSAPVVPAVPIIRQATHSTSVSGVTAGLATMSVEPRGSRSPAPHVSPKPNPLPILFKKGTNRRYRGGNEKPNNSTNKKELKAKPRSTGIPLKEFHLFSKLPTELRLKIYKYAMVQRRLIELEWGPAMGVPTGLGIGSHQWVRVCPRSRLPPALMHMCRESREEAQKVYQLRCFDSRVAQLLPNSPQLHEHWIWYNPNADIIFFGENTCISTFIKVFSRRECEVIPAIAIVSSGKGETCCDHDDGIYGVNGGVNTLQALHGFDPSVTLHDYRYGGCPGLKEVFIVVKSKLWPHKQGEINSFVTLRPATNEGLTKGQARFKERLEGEIARVEAEIALPRVGDNLWKGDKMPTFKFVSIAPVAWGVNLREPDGMAVSRKDLFKLRYASRKDSLKPRHSGWAFVKHTEDVTGCEILVPEEEYRGEDPREIGFWGVRKSIDAAKKAIEERLTSLNTESQ